MKSSSWIASTTAALMLAALSAQAQLPKDPEERAKVIAQIMQANARQITLFDREGKEVERVGSRDLYNQVILSPDRTRIAVIKADLEKEANDLWLLDTATGKGPQSRSANPESRQPRRYGHPMAARSPTLHCGTARLEFSEDLQMQMGQKSSCTRRRHRSR
jgi:hypothetical protein